MEINKQLFEDVLSGKLKGTFVLYNMNKVRSEYLERRLTIWSDKDNKPYAFRDPCTGLRFDYYEDGCFDKSFSITPPYNDIIDFIPDTNMKENELAIEIPNGKIVDWDKSKKQNKIVLKDKQLTYEDVCKKLFNNGYYYTDCSGFIDSCKIGMCYTPNSALTKHQLECILAKNKLATVAKYLNDGWKPLHDNTIVLLIETKTGVLAYEVINGSCASDCGSIWFKSKDLARQAIEILGEETVKLALEPLGI